MRLSSLWRAVNGGWSLAGLRRAIVGNARCVVSGRLHAYGRQAIAAAAIVFVAAGVAAAGAPRIDVRRQGETYFVQASADVAADLSIAWETLTDYERLPQFVPDIHRVRVLARNGNRLTVAFDGGLRLLIFEWPVRMRLAVQHEPYGRVLAQSDPGPIDGQLPTLREFSGRYTLTAVPLLGGTGVRLDYDAQFELTEAVPSLIGLLFGRPLVRAALRGQFEAMLGEIERRQAARPSLQRSTS